jgi:hypothetical protein
MGTSKSFPTPAGGEWTPLKKDITGHLDGDMKATPERILGGAVRALGTLQMPAVSVRGGGAGAAPGRTGSRGGGGGGGGGGAVGRSASRLGGFASAVQSGGLAGGLKVLGLDELKGCSAAEVISRIAEHLAEGADLLQRDLLIDALQNALLEAAALEAEAAYEDLAAALEAFFAANGIEALVQSFLTNYVFDRVWMAVENHAQMKDGAGAGAEALGNAVAQACRSHVESLVSDVKAEGRFDKIDWFGRGGTTLGDELVSELEGRLKAL